MRLDESLQFISSRHTPKPVYLVASYLLYFRCEERRLCDNPPALIQTDPVVFLEKLVVRVEIFDSSKGGSRLGLRMDMARSAARMSPLLRAFQDG